MKIDRILALLKGVRQTGPGQWVALCPAHEDRSPSLSVRDAGDGRTLLNCFAGCPTEDVVSGLGIRMRDLMPDRPLTSTAIKPRPLQMHPDDALDVLGHEIAAAVMLIDGIVTAINSGAAPSREAIERLSLSALRIGRVRNLVQSRTPPEVLAIRRGGL